MRHAKDLTAADRPTGSGRHVQVGPVEPDTFGTHEASSAAFERLIADVVVARVRVRNVYPIDSVALARGHRVGVETRLSAHAQRLQLTLEGLRRFVGQEAIERRVLAIFAEERDLRRGVDGGCLVTKSAVCSRAPSGCQLS